MKSNNNLSNPDFIDHKSPKEDIVNHPYDFIINRILVEAGESISLKELNNNLLEEWREEIMKNLGNALSNIS